MAQRRQRRPKPPGWEEELKRRRERRAFEKRLERAVSEALQSPELAEVREAIFGKQGADGGKGR